MLKKLATFVIISSVLLNIAIPNAKAAESFPVEQFPYKKMHIEVLPEFDYPKGWPEDQPSMLVGYYGTFTNKTGKDFNGKIEFPVPVNEKNFTMFAVSEAQDESKVQLQFEINKEKGVVTWKPAKAIKKDKEYSFVIEYFSNPIEVTDLKKFSFKYVSPTDIENLDILFVEPLKSEKFKMEPAPKETADGDYGEKFFIYEYSGVKKNDPINLSASYLKEDNKSRISIINEQTPPSDANHSGQTATDQVLNGDSKDQPIISLSGAIVIGISIIIAGVFVFLGIRGNNRSSNPTGPKNKNAVKKSLVQKPSQKPTKQGTSEQKKKLRASFMNGEIDEETYEKEMKKLG